MQGYILNTKKSGENHLIVDILTQNKIIKTMRFYGILHSNIMVGNKLDFELEYNANYLPKLVNTIHLGFSWQNNTNIIRPWNDFINALFTHLKSVKECDECYFLACEQISARLFKQSPKRAIVDAYAKILLHEGRLHNLERCHICQDDLKDILWLQNGFLPLCKTCHDASFKKNNFYFKKNQMLDFLQTFNSSSLDDFVIDNLFWLIITGF